MNAVRTLNAARNHFECNHSEVRRIAYHLDLYLVNNMHLVAGFHSRRWRTIKEAALVNPFLPITANAAPGKTFPTKCISRVAPKTDVLICIMMMQIQTDITHR